MSHILTLLISATGWSTSQVYYFSNFSVRKANKLYSSVDFEYSLSFDTR